MIKQIQIDRGQIKISGHPTMCPFCHKSITPNLLHGHQHGRTVELLMFCPNPDCDRAFLGYYDYVASDQSWKFNGSVSQGNLVTREFTETIGSISSSFATIYGQAYAAEQLGLTEICGVGYRKSLEFLIKDYAILNNVEERAKIEKKQLAACIADYVNDSRIKSVAKRAVWLGNDETHYIRKWEGKNLEDLKKLIDLTLHWVEMEALTKSFEEDMPE